MFTCVPGTVRQHNVFHFIDIPIFNVNYPTMHKVYLASSCTVLRLHVRTKARGLSSRIDAQSIQ